MKTSFLLFLVPFLSAALALPTLSPSSSTVSGASILVARTTAGTDALYHNEKRTTEAPDHSDTASIAESDAGGHTNAPASGNKINPQALTTTSLQMLSDGKTVDIEMKWSTKYRKEINQFVQAIKKQEEVTITFTKKSELKGTHRTRAAATSITPKQATKLVELFSERFP